MAWSFNTVGKCETTLAPKGSRSQNLFNSATEVLTVALSNSSNQDLTTSVIDFIPKGSDFVVVANTSATNMSSDADIAVLVSSTRAGTFGLLKDDLIGATDSVVAAAPYLIGSYGEAPYYKLFVDSDGVQKKADTFTITVYWE